VLVEFACRPEYRFEPITIRRKTLHLEGTLEMFPDLAPERARRFGGVAGSTLGGHCVACTKAPVLSMLKFAQYVPSLGNLICTTYA
jgi:hypothetical protein